MEINPIDQQVSVSGQITTADIPSIVDLGVEVLVCNRPDYEVPDQPTFDDIQHAAQAAGLEVVNIPFAGGQMLPEQAVEFAELLKTGKRIHAYCRTGNRSTKIWQAAKQPV